MHHSKEVASPKSSTAKIEDGHIKDHIGICTRRGYWLEGNLVEKDTNADVCDIFAFQSELYSFLFCF